MGNLKFVTAVAGLLFLACVSAAWAQGEVHATVITVHGTSVDLVLKPVGSGATRTMAVNWLNHNLGRGTTRLAPEGTVLALEGHNVVVVPYSQIARADLVAPGTATHWQFTLRDGRVLEGSSRAYGDFLRITGVTTDGKEETLSSFQQQPGQQAFVTVIFDAAFVNDRARSGARVDVDTVALRNGDVLSGSILTIEFTVQASYGTLTFTQEQLASIAIEDSVGRTDQFILNVGDRVSGVLQNASIQMTLTSGATITLEKGNIASITFAVQQ